MTATSRVDDPRAAGEAGRLGVCLVALLVITHVFVVGGLTLWLVGTAGAGDVSELSIAAVVLAAIVVAGTIGPFYRWARSGVVDLLSTQVTLEVAPFAAVDDTAGGTPGDVLAAMASTMRSVLDLGAIEIETWPTSEGPGERDRWRSGASCAIGRGLGDPLVVPLTGDGGSIGQVSAWGRRGRRLPTATARGLTQLVGHVELVVRSGLMREALEASRQALVVAREEERRRLRRDLHDGLGPTLAAMKLQLARLRRELADASSSATIGELRDMMNEATDEVRRVIEDLRPPLLDDCGLVDALRNLRFVPADLLLTVHAPDPFPPLPAAVEVALYRIGAEAVHNTVRHARATRCTVELRVDADHATVVITDDGEGRSVGHPLGTGTTAIIERTRELGGTATIGPAHQRGLAVTAVLPLRGTVSA